MTWTAARKHADKQIDGLELKLFRNRVTQRLEQFRTGSAAAVDQLAFPLAWIPVDRAGQLGLIRRRAMQSTLVLDLGSNDTRLPTSFVSAVFAARYRIRVIALVRSLDVADAALGAYARQMKYARLRPIARRPEAIDRLLDRMLVERGSPLRISQVTPENPRALRTYGWPDNFASLREAADRLTAIARVGSINGAASTLGIPRATLHHGYSKILGLSPPLVPSPGTA